MNFLKRYRHDFIIALLIIALAIIFYALRDQFGILSKRESLEQFVSGFGVWAPIVIILLFVLEVVIAPLPGFVLAVSAGFIFGPIEGSVYTYIGNLLGSFLVFWLSRRFGRPLVERFLDEKKLVRYEQIIERRENILLIFYFFPLLPLDIITGAFGISKISFKKFAITIAIGFIFYVVALNFFGDYLAGLYFMI